MIDQATIERIKDAADIEDVVRSYGVSLKRKGGSLWANCPFPGHEEKTPSFCVTPSKGMCKCFGCGKGGDSIGFVRIMDGIGYLDALRVLAKKYNIELQEHQLTNEEKQLQDKRESLFAINEFADQWFQDQMWKTAEGQRIAWTYFNNRGIREDIARDFHLGYCPDTYNTFFRAATQADYNESLLEELGLCKKNEKGNYWDFFRGRVIFPIHTAAGRVIAFGGRILEKRDDAAKYYNSKESDEFYVKSKELYGLFQARKTIHQKDHCYLCEGYMDVIAMHQNGLSDAIASCGTSLTEQQAKRISRETHNITILYDGDKAGIKAAIRAIDLLLPNDMKINVLVLPDDDDPDSFAHKHTTEEYVNYIEGNQTNWIDYLISYAYNDSLNDINKQTETTRQFIERLALIPDSIYRNICIKTTADKLNFDINFIAQQVDQLIGSKRQTTEQQFANSFRPNNYQQQLIPTPPAQQVEQNAFSLDSYAKNILQIILRHGNIILYPDTDYAISVSDYIYNDLQADNITFDNQLLQQMLEEYMLVHNQPDFDAAQEFISHPNPDVQSLAFELLIDPVPLSKFFEIEDKTIPLTTGKNSQQDDEIIVKRMPSDADNINELAPRVLYEYKLRILRNRQIITQQQMTEAYNAGNNELVMQLIKQLESISRTIRPIADYLKIVLL